MNCYKTKTMRGANMIAANPDKRVSADGQRSALGRNVKGETSTPGVFAGYRKWTLKERRITLRGARWVMVTETFNAAEADAWVK